MSDRDAVDEDFEWLSGPRWFLIWTSHDDSEQSMQEEHLREAHDIRDVYGKPMRILAQFTARSYGEARGYMRAISELRGLYDEDEVRIEMMRRRRNRLAAERRCRAK